MTEKHVRVNEQINVSPVRLIDEEGEQVGIIPLIEAQRQADEAGLDLVEVSPNTKPPVCRIMDYGKYLYEIAKRSKIVSKKRHVIHIKEIKMRPEISKHDFDFKIKHAIEFINRGDRVKFTLVFRGRQILHQDHGETVLQRVIESLRDIAVVETDIHHEGRNLSILMSGK